MQPAPGYVLTGWLFVKGLALIYAAAFASLAVQIDGLAGPDGILPFRRLLQAAFSQEGYGALLRLPTLFWLNSSGGALQGAAIAGAVLAVLLLLGRIRPRRALIALFVLYLSLVHAGQIFTAFQWDYLLLESGFLAIFLGEAPMLVIVLLYDWLLFRLRFLSGWFKLASGDPSWRDFTALDYYFETQPLPHVGSWYAHQLPHWLHQAGVGFTLFAELIVPFFIFLPRPFRIFAAITTILAQLLIIATSNHNFINLLTILLCLFVLDDPIVARVLPGPTQDRILRRARAQMVGGDGAAASGSPRERIAPRAPVVAKGAPERSGRSGCSSSVPADHLRVGPTARVAAGAAAALVLALSCSMLLAVHARRPMPRVLAVFNGIAPAFGIGNLFHLFPTMQIERQELRIFGSYDGRTWEAYEFRYKPDALDRAPPFIVPHQPRLDWMMWFLPPQWPDTGYWFAPFLESLRQNRIAVTDLLGHNPFEGKPPPSQLRVLAYRYRFTTAQERARTGDWWTAEYLGEFPDVPARNP